MVAGLLTALVMALLPVGPAAPAAGAAAGNNLPSQLSLGSDVKQLVTVTSSGWSDKRATLRTWRRVDGQWKLRGKPFVVRLGYGAWVRAGQRRQGTGATPAGRFTMPYAFGNRADPGTSMRYRHVDGSDVWPYEPRDRRTYNIFQPSRAAGSNWRADYYERLKSYGREYAYAVVLGFNLPSGVHWSKKRKQHVADNPADTARGGGIFLHVQGSEYTAGCVAGPMKQVRRAVRWLDPEQDPRIVMGPTRWVKQKF